MGEEKTSWKKVYSKVSATKYVDLTNDEIASLYLQNKSRPHSYGGIQRSGIHSLKNKKFFVGRTIKNGIHWRIRRVSSKVWKPIFAKLSNERETTLSGDEMGQLFLTPRIDGVLHDSIIPELSGKYFSCHRHVDGDYNVKLV
jgi:hypothetical protein